MALQLDSTKINSAEEEELEHGDSPSRSILILDFREDGARYSYAVPWLAWPMAAKQNLKSLSLLSRSHTSLIVVSALLAYAGHDSHLRPYATYMVVVAAPCF